MSQTKISKIAVCNRCGRQKDKAFLGLWKTGPESDSDLEKIYLNFCQKCDRKKDPDLNSNNK